MEAGTLQIVDNNYDNENNKKRYLFHLPCCGFAICGDDFKLLYPWSLKDRSIFF